MRNITEPENFSFGNLARVTYKGQPCAAEEAIIYHKYISPAPPAGRKEADMTAQELFCRIGYGKQNAVRRPADSYTDRKLRRLIEKANQNGDCVINCRDGYYRPRLDIEEERHELSHYLAAELHRGRAILYKRKNMKETAQKWGEVICQTADKRERPEKESLPESCGNMVIVVEEDNSIPGQMAMRML